jgi:hypothetical protein
MRAVFVVFGIGDAEVWRKKKSLLEKDDMVR